MITDRRPPLPILLLSILALAGAAGGCVRAPGNGGYVALGSSFAAGPGIGERVPGSPPRCKRSSQNYAHLLAAKRGLALTDVTCSGATVDDLLHAGHYDQPAQLDALRDTTALVTITIGGNDVAFHPNLYAWSCAQAPDRVPEAWRQRVCNATADAEVDAALAGLEERLRRLVLEIHRRAPRARVVFVDYITVLPERGNCPDLLPITDEQLTRARGLERALAEATARAARDSGSLLVSAAALTRGHDVCSADPWVVGLTFPRNPLDNGALAFHPIARAMEAIAAALDRAL